MLKDKFVYIFLLVCILSFGQNKMFGQSKMKLASIQQASGGGAVYAGNNAADPVNEVNATTGTSSTDGEITWTSSSANPQDGTYSLRAEKTGGTDNDTSTGLIELTGVSNGDNVTVTVYIDESTTVGTNWQILAQTFRGWTTGYDTTTSGTGYQPYTFTDTATQDNPPITIRTTSAGDLNDLVDVDNIVITIN